MPGIEGRENVAFQRGSTHEHIVAIFAVFFFPRDTLADILWCTTMELCCIFEEVIVCAGM